MKKIPKERKQFMKAHELDKQYSFTRSFLLANTANVHYHDIRYCGTKRNKGEVGVLALYEEIWEF